MEQVVAALSRVTFTLDEHDMSFRSNLSFDDTSDSASVESVSSIGDIIEEMKLCTECLVNLSPSLENPAKDLEIVELSRAPKPMPEEFQAWWQFFLRVEDKFPTADRNLVLIIGQSIWRRWEKIRLNHVTKAEALGIETVVYKPGIEMDIQSHYSESNISTQYTQTSLASGTTFSAPSIFSKTDEKGRDTEPEEYINPNARLRRYESFSSVRSSLATDASKSGQQKVPPMPKECRNGDEFECFVCEKRISDIQSREAWKKHIFGDLEPYICTFAKCQNPLKTFKSRLEWTKHEVTIHEAEYQKRLKAGICPLCRKAVYPAKQLSRHLGRHLRELSLASLPPIGIPEEEEKESEKARLSPQAFNESRHGLEQETMEEASSRRKAKKGKMKAT
ncbi:hypothetical protein L207DRAFT_521047 [Hyaloscypha variabilis F]|uniref:C2H2-type domain-containing protein n=1 Tax=Hyaloscypha variabilis (strain UAMH 11265 / GT02V1 / F) TaxID=1149755 RepID=A0A2J6QSY6_HYAVF|nr:hypothetical protein L207DRAFT_521047 [Hyaloscypha variabilis F]